MPAIVQWKRLVALSFVLVLLTSAVLVVLGTGTAQAAKSERERKIAHALEIARNQKGDPYQYGADGPNRFDCSGLTQFAFGKAGLSMPRTSDDQSGYVRRLHDRGNIRAGDFMFFADGATSITWESSPGVGGTAAGSSCTRSGRARRSWLTRCGPTTGTLRRR